MQAKLEVLRGAKPTTIAMKLPTVIGRGGEANIKLPASTVSRHHCELYLFEGQLVIRDLGSSNGTIVNGHKIKGPTYLTPNDEFSVGPVSMRTILAAYEQTPPLMPDKNAEALPPDARRSEDRLAQPNPDRTAPIDSPPASPLDAEIPPPDDEDSFLAYSEDDDGGFLGIARLSDEVPRAVDAGPLGSVDESPVFEADTQPDAVDSDDSALHNFFNNLDN
jgi:hypothetical protein